jgi:hypothetical protein
MEAAPACSCQHYELVIYGAGKGISRLLAPGWKRQDVVKLAWANLKRVRKNSALHSRQDRTLACEEILRI